MENILFSIVIPTYNSGSTIASAIESVLAQNFKKFELLIIDGCSNDDTLIIIKSYIDPCIRFISETDKGVYDAMNKAIQIAKGEWLFFLGSDDVMHDENVLDDIHSFISNQTKLDVLYGDALFKNSGIKHYGSSSLERIMYENNICHQAIFYNHTVFKRLGTYNLAYTLYADWDLNIRCFMHPEFTIKYVDRLISIYNENSGISAKFIDTDVNFSKILPIYRLRLQTKIFLESYDYKIGNKLMWPIRWCRKVAKSIIHKR